MHSLCRKHSIQGIQQLQIKEFFNTFSDHYKERGEKKGKKKEKWHKEKFTFIFEDVHGKCFLLFSFCLFGLLS